MSKSCDTKETLSTVPDLRGLKRLLNAVCNPRMDPGAGEKLDKKYDNWQNLNIGYF